MALGDDACGDKGRADVARRGGRACEDAFGCEGDLTSRIGSIAVPRRAGTSH